MLRKALLTLPFLLIASQPVISGPGPAPTIAQDVGVCDPFNPKNCMQPLANGSINVNATIPTPPPASIPIYTPTGYCRLSVTSAVQTSTCSGGIPALTNYLTVCGETADSRWSDTTTPTTGPLGVGAPFPSGSCMPYYLSGSALQWVSQDGTPVALTFQFYQIH